MPAHFSAFLIVFYGFCAMARSTCAETVTDRSTLSPWQTADMLFWEGKTLVVYFGPYGPSKYNNDLWIVLTF